MLHAFCVKIFHFQWLKLNFVSLHGCNVSASLKIIDATFSETPPERYWELLAEERRLALQNALEENERVGSELYSTLFHFWNIQCLAVIILPFFFYTASQRTGRVEREKQSFRRSCWSGRVFCLSVSGIIRVIWCVYCLDPLNAE